MGKSLIKIYKLLMNSFIKNGISEEAIRILKMSPEKRTDDHIKSVCASLIDSVPEFAEFSSSIQKSIAKCAIFQEIGAGRVIIRQNHRADNYYFIVSGVATVSVLTENSSTGELENKDVAFLRKGNSFGVNKICL